MPSTQASIVVGLCIWLGCQAEERKGSSKKTRPPHCIERCREPNSRAVLLLAPARGNAAPARRSGQRRRAGGASFPDTSTTTCTRTHHRRNRKLHLVGIGVVSGCRRRKDENPRDCNQRPCQHNGAPSPKIVVRGKFWSSHEPRFSLVYFQESIPSRRSQIQTSPFTAMYDEAHACALDQCLAAPEQDAPVPGQ